MVIEDRFPIATIQKIIRLESQRRQFYRPIYSIHKSWARRPGSAVRAIALSHFTDSKLFHPNKLGKGAFYENHNFRNTIALDPFCGGGTSLIELNRLGVKTVGIDINPVALFTTKKELDPFNQDRFDEAVNELSKTIGKRIRSYYKTICPICESPKADIMYTFWIRTIICPICGSNEDLFKYYIIGVKQRKDRSTMVICPKCNSLFYSIIKLNDVTKCVKCDFEFIPKKGNSRLKKFECTQCGYQAKLISLIRENQESLSTRQIAIEFYCQECNIRDYKPITKYDIMRYDEIAQEFFKKEKDLIYPKELLPKKGNNVSNLHNYGFIKFSDLFNERQLLCLSLLLNEISQIPDQNVKEYLLAAFSSSLEFHTVLCPYNYTMKQIVNIFNYQSFLVPTMYVENNVWGTKKGNGTFRTYIDRIKKAKIYCQSPFEIAINKGKVVKIPIKGDKIKANNLESFQELKNSSSNDTLLLVENSEDLSKIIPENSVDIIITDPPYYDFISYSELANFFFVWLKIVLKEKYPAFRSDLINAENELGVQRKEKIFLKQITKVFQECNRILKDKSPLIFTFHHSNHIAWAMILQAISDSHFVVTSAFPIHSEFQARPVSGSNFDFIIVCKKLSNLSRESKINDIVSLNREIENVIKKFLSNNYSEELILMKEEVFSKILPLLSEFKTINPSPDLKQIFKNVLGLIDNLIVP